MGVNRPPHRCYAVLDGENEATWWTTVDAIMFERREGDRKEVHRDQLTWVGHGLADPGLYPLFEKKVLYSEPKCKPSK